ncbi:MAG: AAA family ATPase [Planctomycetes bacterium]|nr:AAA family ATPase [Planctomycetota bacterium]
MQDGATVYGEHFQLRELPFNNTPDPRFFFPTPDHEEALASLIYAVTQSKGFVLLTGEVGTGKTLISRILMRKFGDHVAFAAINNAYLTANDLLAAVCQEFNLDVSLEAGNLRLARALEDHLLDQFSRGRPVALILDEAQNLSDEAFEQLRMIGNLEADDAKLLQIVILGQPELRDRFRSPDLRQLRQRIFRSYHLPALTRELCEAYIVHRLTRAGHPDGHVFDTSAVDAIFEFSSGLPRLINTACDNALLSAYSADQTAIDACFVKTVIDQMLDLEQHAREFEARPPALLVPENEGIQAAPTVTTPARETTHEHRVARQVAMRSADVSSPRRATSNDATATGDQSHQFDSHESRRDAATETSMPSVIPEPDMGRIERLTELVRGLTRDAERAAAVLLESCEPTYPTGARSLPETQLAQPHPGSTSHDLAARQRATRSSGAMQPTPALQSASSVKRFRRPRVGGLRRLLDDSRQTLTALHQIAASAYTNSAPLDPDDVLYRDTDSPESAAGKLAHAAMHVAKVAVTSSTT